MLREFFIVASFISGEFQNTYEVVADANSDEEAEALAIDAVRSAAYSIGYNDVDVEFESFECLGYEDDLARDNAESGIVSCIEI